ncbi:aspartic proteinase [Pycnococcus provasolii]
MAAPYGVAGRNRVTHAQPASSRSRSRRRAVHVAAQANSNSTATKQYVVQAGDSLFDIAFKHGVTLAELRDANSLKGDKGKGSWAVTISPGQALNLPPNARPAASSDKKEETKFVWPSLPSLPKFNNTAASSKANQPTTVTTAKPRTTTTTTTTKTATATSASPLPEFYTVKPGDTLEDIAERHGTSVAEIKGQNSNRKRLKQVDNNTTPSAAAQTKSAEKGCDSNGGPTSSTDPDLWPANQSAVRTLTRAQAELMLDGEVSRDSVLCVYAPWCRFCKAMEDDFENFARRLPRGKVGVYCLRGDATPSDREWTREVLNTSTFPTIIAFPASDRSGVGSTAYKYDDDVRTPEALLAFLNGTTGAKYRLDSPAKAKQAVAAAPVPVNAVSDPKYKVSLSIGLVACAAAAAAAAAVLAVRDRSLLPKPKTDKMPQGPTTVTYNSAAEPSSTSEDVESSSGVNKVDPEPHAPKETRERAAAAKELVSVVGKVPRLVWQIAVGREKVVKS